MFYTNDFWYTGLMSLADLLSILLIAVGLAADCFAVALSGSISLKKLRKIQVLRTALAFGIAQTLMPVIGWAVGHTAIDLISGYDHWIAFGLLTIVGGRMIWEAFHEDEKSREGADISRGWLLITLAMATSIDALAVGLSFAFLHLNIIYSSLIIGAVAFFLTILGFYLGRKAGALFGQRAKIVGGIILIGIGVRILVSHLLG
jgi:manganese efflux pump family protein